MTFGVPNTSYWGTPSTKAHKRADWLHSNCHLGVPSTLEQRGKSAVADELHSNSHPNALERGNKYSNGPKLGKLATQPLPSRVP